jgi:hypothetical protein
MTQRATRCTRHQITVSYGPVGAAAGSVSAAIRLTNLSARPCRLAGYLTVQRLTSSGSSLATRVVHAAAGMSVFPDPGPHRITLDRSATASAMLGWRDNPATTTSGRPLESCRPSYLLRVSLPGRNHGVIVATGKPNGTRYDDRIEACSGRLTLTAVQGRPNPKKL